MANTITEIRAYVQVMCFRKDYINSVLTSELEDSVDWTGDVGAWFTFATDGTPASYQLNPLLIRDTAMSIVVADSVNPTLSSIGLALSLADVVEYIRDALDSNSAYVFSGRTSLIYKVFTFGGVDYIVPAIGTTGWSSYPPMNIRYVYTVQYTLGGSTVQVCFPGEAMQTYETVLNAGNSWQFIPTGNSNNRSSSLNYRLYREDGSLISAAYVPVDGEVNMTFEELPAYVVVAIGVRSPNVQHVETLNTRFKLKSQTFSKTLVTSSSLANVPPSSALGQILDIPWTLETDNGGGKSTTIDGVSDLAYKVTSRYKKYFATKIDAIVNVADIVVIVEDPTISNPNAISIVNDTVLNLTSDVEQIVVSEASNKMVFDGSAPLNLTLATISNPTAFDATAVFYEFTVERYRIKYAPSGLEESEAVWGSYRNNSSNDSIGGGIGTLISRTEDIPLHLVLSNVDAIKTAFGIAPEGEHSTDIIYAGIFKIRTRVTYTYLGADFTVDRYSTLRYGVNENDISISNWSPTISSRVWSKITYNLDIAPSKDSLSESILNLGNSFPITLTSHILKTPSGTKPEISTYADIKPDILLSSYTPSDIPNTSLRFSNLSAVNNPTQEITASATYIPQLTLVDSTGSQTVVEGSEIVIAMNTTYGISVPLEVEFDTASDGVITN